MCKVLIDVNKVNKDFVLYNYLYSQNNRTISLEELKKGWGEFHKSYNDADIDVRLDHYINNGLLIKQDNKYKVRM